MAADYNEETVQYNILLQAVEALKALDDLNAKASSVTDIIGNTSNAVENFSQQSGLSINAVKTLFQSLEDRAIALREAIDQLGPVALSELEPLAATLATIQGPTGQLGPSVGNAAWTDSLAKAKADQADLNAEMAEYDKLTQASAQSTANLDTFIKTSSVNMKDLVAYLTTDRGQTFIDRMFFDLQSGMPVVQTMEDAIVQLSAETGASTSQIGNTLQATINGMGGVTVSASETKQAIKGANEELDAMPEKVEKANSGFNVMRTILGTLVAVGVFQLKEAITQTFTQAITLANDYAKSLYQIQVAQDVLAQRGVTVTQQQLLDIVKQINQEFGVFSQVELTNAVAQASLLTQNFGFTKDQITQVVQIASALAIQEGDIKSLPNDIEQITRALTTGTAPAALSKLGIDAKASSTEVKALEQSLYGATTGLTDQQVAAATLDVIMQHLNPEMKDFGTYQDTLPGKADKTSKSWQDLLTDVGKAFNFAKGGFADFTNSFIEFLDKALKGYYLFHSQVLAGWDTLLYAIKNHETNIDKLTQVYQTDFQKQIDLFKGLTSSADTATQSVNTLGTSLVDMSKVDLTSLVNSITSMSDQMDKTTQSFLTSQQNKEQDYYTQRLRDQQDYETKRAQTIADYNAKITDSNAKYHQQEQDAEAKFQEKMRQLREQYLYDLEGALRARDAGQVLRLQEKYQMDKTAAENDFALQQKTSNEQHAQELADAKKAEQAKLAQDEQAFNTKEQRALEDYNTSRNRAVAQYQQTIADEKKAWEDRLKQEAQKLADQLGVQGKGADDIYALLKEYFGPDGKLDGLYDYSYSSLNDRSKALLDSIAATVKAVAAEMAQAVQSLSGSQVHSESSGGSATTPYSNPKPLTGSQIHGNRAQGGIDIANKPTSVTFGEAGPEAHIFIPLSNGMSLPSSIGGATGGAGGKVGIEITLSPDLEHRITENTLNKAAEVVTKVRRSSK